MKATTCSILERIVHDVDWFFKDVLLERYAKRRQSIKAVNEENTLVIDYIIQYHLGYSDENDLHGQTSDVEELFYPPNSSEDWMKFYKKVGKPTQSGYRHQFQQILLIYLRSDLQLYVNQKGKPTRAARTRDKAKVMTLEDTLTTISSIIGSLDTPICVAKFATGIWGVDNEDTQCIQNNLTYPRLRFCEFVESSHNLTRLIVDLLTMSGNLKIAFFIRKNQRSDEFEKSYDDTYASLLISTNQLVDALVYERLFQNDKDYKQTLQSFFDLGAKYNVLESFNRMKLTQEEGYELDQLVQFRSRPVTPSSTQATSQSRTPRTPSKSKSVRTPPADPPARNTRSAIKKKVERSNIRKTTNKQS